MKLDSSLVSEYIGGSLILNNLRNILPGGNVVYRFYEKRGIFRLDIVTINCDMRFKWDNNSNSLKFIGARGSETLRMYLSTNKELYYIEKVLTNFLKFISSKSPHLDSIVFTLPLNTRTCYIKEKGGLHLLACNL